MSTEIGSVKPGEFGQFERIMLLDVRTPMEFAGESIEGSLLIPLHALEAKETASHLANTSCVIICKSGGRARKAAEQLKAAGAESLYVLEGGIDAWKAAGLPVKQGRKVLSLERQVRIGAGTLVLTGAILGLLVNPAWIFLSALVGAGLIFAGITDFCGMGLLLARMPWNQTGGRPADISWPTERPPRE